MATTEDEDIRKYSDLYYWLKCELPELPDAKRSGSKVLYRHVGPNMTTVRQNLRHDRGEEKYSKKISLAHHPTNH